MGSPFSFWSAGTDGGVPSETRKWPRRSFWLTIAAFAVVVIVVALLTR